MRVFGLAAIVLVFSGTAMAQPLLSSGRPGVTPLMMAAFSGSLERAEALLLAGARVGETAADGMTPLHFAAMRASPAVVARLLDAGADLSARNRNGMTALLLAAEYNPDPAVTALLLKRGARVGDRDVRQRTALIVAAGRNNADVVEVLLAAGADPAAADARHRTAAAHAQFGNAKLAGTPTFWTLYQGQYR